MSAEGKRRAFVRLPDCVGPDVRRAVENACWENHFRSTTRRQTLPGPDIVDRIGDSDVLIADVTRFDPAVTHDIGVAHALGVPVLCLSHHGVDVDLADLRGLRVIYYGDLGDAAERTQLAHTLGRRLRTLVRLTEPCGEVIDSFSDRALAITRDVRRVREAGKPDADTVWFSGFLGDFAVSEAGLESGEVPFKKHLLEQRQALVDLADEGFRLNCILSLPSSDFVIRHNLGIVVRRLRALLDFVREDDSGEDGARRRICWVVSPYRQKNFYIIGSVSCIERFQKAPDRGVDLTLRLTSDAALRANTLAYQALLENLIAGLSPGGLEDERATLRFLRRDTVTRIERALAFCSEGTAAITAQGAR